MTKRYRLIRDIQHPIGNIKIKSGGIYKADGRFYKCEEQGHELLNEYVENNPEWFSEIKGEEPEYIFWNSKKYEVRERSNSGTRMILKEVKEESPQNSWSDNDMIEFANNCYNEAMNTKAAAKNTAPYYFPSPTLYFEQLEKRKSCK